MEKVTGIGCSLACITGGEPLIQNDTIELIRSLLSDGFKVDVETNGANDISVLPLEENGLFISMDVKTPSSGESSRFLPENLSQIRNDDQIKFIIKDEADLDFTFNVMEKHLPKCNIIITPCSNTGGRTISEKFLKVIGNTKKGPLMEVHKRARLMIQTHKVIWDPEERGV
jgi:7-carboxy-7-deazaguanine synthase